MAEGGADAGVIGAAVLAAQEVGSCNGGGRPGDTERARATATEGAE